MFNDCQRTCHELGLFWVVVFAREKKRDMIKEVSIAFNNTLDIFIGHPKLAAIERGALHFEMGPSLLMHRRVYDDVDGAVRLRLAVPTGGVIAVEVPGAGKRDLSLRARIMLEYQKCVLGPRGGAIAPTKE